MVTVSPPQIEPVQRVTVDMPGHFEHEILGFEVKPGSMVAGRTLGDLVMPEGMKIMAAIRDGVPQDPVPGLDFRPGDFMYFLAQPQALAHLAMLRLEREREGHVVHRHDRARDAHALVQAAPRESAPRGSVRLDAAQPQGLPLVGTRGGAAWRDRAGNHGNYGSLGALASVPMQDFRIAPFYGCYILRPSWELGFDDPENPQSLERVIKTVGGEPVAYAGRTKCCGFPIILEKEAIAVAMAGAHMKEAKEQGADFMVTPCPLCHMSLDIYQDRAGRAVNRALDLPILHLPQLLGLAMGLPAKDLGFSRHVISVDSILATLDRHRTHPQPS